MIRTAKQRESDGFHSEHSTMEKPDVSDFVFPLMTIWCLKHGSPWVLLGRNWKFLSHAPVFLSSMQNISSYCKLDNVLFRSFLIPRMYQDKLDTISIKHSFLCFDSLWSSYFLLTTVIKSPWGETLVQKAALVHNVFSPSLTLRENLVSGSLWCWLNLYTNH